MNIDSDPYRRLIDIGRALSAEKNIESLLERILTEAKSMVHADAGTLYLVTTHDALQFAIVLNDKLHIYEGGKSGVPVSLPEIPLTLENGEPNLRNIATRSAITGDTINIEDMQRSGEADPVGTLQFDDITGYCSKSFLTVPLKNNRGETIGVLQLLNALDEAGQVIAFSEEVEPLIEALASQAAVALENRYLLDEQEDLKRQLEREVDERTEELKSALEKLSEAHIILKELTTIDAVTGIRNRQYFDEVYNQEWRRAVRQQYPMTIMLLDIDHFKKVNDTFGHLAGDECLNSVAKDIDSMFNRPSDVVARYGGEEFIVILPYVELGNARHLAEQVRKRIEGHTVNADGHEIKVTISIGVAAIVPKDGADPKSLIGHADVALYQAKSRGRNTVVAFNEVD